MQNFMALASHYFALDADCVAALPLSWNSDFAELTLDGPFSLQAEEIQH